MPGPEALYARLLMPLKDDFFQVQSVAIVCNRKTKLVAGSIVQSVAIFFKIPQVCPSSPPFVFAESFLPSFMY